VALPDLLVWWFLLPSLWRGLWSAKRRIGLRALTLLIPAAMTGVALSLLIGNFGTVLRERTQVVVLLMPFIALGLAEHRRASTPGEEPPADGVDAAAAAEADDRLELRPTP
jgi:hypothetical protein